MLNTRDWCIMLILAILYTLISCINFAGTNQYHSRWQATHPLAQLAVTFNHPTEIKQIYVATALNSGDYTVSLFDGKQIVIESFTQSSAKLSAAPFRWNRTDIKHNLLPISNITLMVTKPMVDLSGLAVVDSHQQLITDYTIQSVNDGITSSANNLIMRQLPMHIENDWQSGTVFDEIYYATSAYQYLHSISPGAWVNPQLGILLIAVGILICGMSPLGWRIMPNLSSILLVPIIYIFAKRIFKSSKVATATTILMCCEFMHYTIGRIAMIEPFVALFLTIEYYFLYCYIDDRFNGKTFRQVIPSLIGVGINLGLATAAKWVGVFSAPAILICVLIGELKLLPFTRAHLLKWGCLIVLLVILPAGVYLLTYLPYAMVNHSLSNFFSSIYQLHMWMLDFNLHGLAHATHPYASRFWSWSLDIMPLSVYYWQDGHGYLSSSMVLMGNPAIFWPTWVVVALLAVKWLENRTDYRAGFLLLVVVAQYLPYALISRISFIYYFYSVTPLLILAIGYALNLVFMQTKHRYHYLAYSYLALVAVLFMLFFPALSAIIVPRAYTVHVLWWLRPWNF